MAKSKKLNKRVVVVWMALGALLVLFAVTVLLRKKPVDPVASAAQGDVWLQRSLEARKAGNVDQANKAARKAAKEYGLAVKDDAANAVYKYKHAQAIREVLKSPDLISTDRRQMTGRMLRSLQAAAQGDHPDSLRMLCDLYWDESFRVARDPQRALRTLSELVSLSEQLLEAVGDDAAVHHRLGSVRARLAEMDPATLEHKEHAIAHLRKAVELEGDNVTFRLSLIVFLARDEPEEKVREEYKSALAAIPADAKLRVSYANYLQKNDHAQEALEQIEAAIRKDPNNPEGYMARAVLHDRDGKRDLALQVLIKAREVAPHDARVFGILAQVYKRLGQDAEAVETVRQGLKDAANRAAGELKDDERARLVAARIVLNHLLATLLLEQAEEPADSAQRPQWEKWIAEARACQEAIEKLAPGHAYAAKIAGHLAYVKGKLLDAIPLLESAEAVIYTQTRRADLKLVNLLIACYASTGQSAKAERLLERLRQLPGQRNNPAMLLSLARFRIRSREYERAGLYVDSALRIDPHNEDAKDLKKTLLALRGGGAELASGTKVSRAALPAFRDRMRALWAEGKREEAAELGEKVLAGAPKDLATIRLLVTMHLELKQAGKARAIQEKVRTYDGQFADELGFQIELAAAKPEDRFQKLINRAEQTGTTPIGRALAKAQICKRLDKKEEFLAYLQQAAEIDATDGMVVGLFFEHALREQRLEEAAKWARAAAANNTDRVGGKLFEAQLALARREWKDAAALLEKVLVERPDMKMPRSLLGDIYLAMKDYDRAEEAYREALNLDRAYVKAMVGRAKVADLKGRRGEADLWVTQAYGRPEGQNDPYVRGRYLEIQERKQDPKILAEVIRQREIAFRKSPDDLANCIRLGSIYERVKRNADAEKKYLHVFVNSADKLVGVGPLLDFYVRTRQTGKVFATEGKLRETVPDKLKLALLMGDAWLAGDPSWAEAKYRAAVKIAPKSTDARRRLASLLVSQGKHGPAIQELEEVRRHDPDNRPVIDDLIRYRIESREEEQWARARGELEKLLAANPTDYEALTRRGLLFYRRGRMGEALRDLDLAVREAPASYLLARRVRAQVHRARGDNEEALKELQALRQQTNNPEIAQAYAELCRATGNTTGAEIAYKSALELRPDDPRLLCGLMDLYVQGQKWSALEARAKESESILANDPAYFLIQYKMWSARGNQPKALAALEEALKVAAGPERPPVVAAILPALLEYRQGARVLAICRQHAGQKGYGFWLTALEARALADTGQKARADVLFRTALQEAGKTGIGDAIGVFGQMQRAYGPAPAVEKLDAWSKGPLAKDFGTALLLVRIRVGSGKLDQAAAAALRAVQLAQSDEEKGHANAGLGLAYQQGKKYSQAEQAYRQALAASPNLVEALNNLAYLYAEELHRPQDALPYAQRAYQQRRDSPEIIDTYGWTLAQLGRWADAEERLAQAVQLHQGDGGGVYCYHLGYIHEKTERFDAAAKQYREALRRAKDAKDGILAKTVATALERIEPHLEGSKK